MNENLHGSSLRKELIFSSQKIDIFVCKNDLIEIFLMKIYLQLVLFFHDNPLKRHHKNRFGNVSLGLKDISMIT